MKIFNNQYGISINNFSINRILRCYHKINYFLISHYVKGFDRLRKILAKLLFNIPKHPLIISTIYDFEMKIEPQIDLSIERSLYFFGTYETGILRILKYILEKGNLFVDVGAHIGLYSIFASKYVGEKGQIISFEPNPSAFALLQENIKLNKINNIEANMLALGAKKEVLKLQMRHLLNRGSASLRSMDMYGNGDIVKVNRLDDFLHSHFLTKVDIMKIDVEGWEFNVLKGAGMILKSKDAPIIIVEVNREIHSDGYLTDMLNYILKQNQYKLFKLEKDKEVISNLIPFKCVKDLLINENIFCFLTTHLNKLPRKIFKISKN